VNSNHSELQAWALLLAAREIADGFSGRAIPTSATAVERRSPFETVSFHYQATSRKIVTVAGKDSDADLVYAPNDGWQYSAQLSAAVRHMLDLYLPVLGTHEDPAVVLAHLGQSLDSRIATSRGDACFVTGEENRRHLHRLRSLCHAVIVGAGTVIADDPQLTTRSVSGPSPVRVVIDPRARVPAGLGLLVDGQAPTWLLHEESIAVNELPVLPGCQRLTVRSHEGIMQPRDILDVLATHGIRRVFIEGGGVTVSRFFNGRCLHRLHIATAPVLVGDGIPALQMPGADTMHQALRPRYRLYRMGEDVLWDFELEGGGDAVDDDPSRAVTIDKETQSVLQRLL
jgi:riboflavin-specific deaminase-like protein